jgi:hypothetical protein
MTAIYRWLQARAAMGAIGKAILIVTMAADLLSERENIG